MLADDANNIYPTYEAVGSLSTVAVRATLTLALIDLILYKSIGKPLGILIRDEHGASFTSLQDIITKEEVTSHDKENNGSTEISRVDIASYIMP